LLKLLDIFATLPFLSFAVNLLGRSQLFMVPSHGEAVAFLFSGFAQSLSMASFLGGMQVGDLAERQAASVFWWVAAQGRGEAPTPVRNRNSFPLPQGLVTSGRNLTSLGQG
jgi:hypothetical protein